MACYSGPNIIEDGIVMYLDATNTKSYSGSGSTWTDMSGQGNNATISGCDFPEAASAARIFSFDGTNDKISVASSSDLTFGTGDFTVECWVNPDDFGSRGTLYDSRPSNGSTGITIGHESSSGEIRVYMNASSGSDIVVQSSDFATGQWQHIVVTRSSGTVSLFINGVSKDSETRTSNLNNTNSVNIGYKTYTSSTYDYFDGDIAAVSVYKGRGLTAAEVRQNYYALKSRVESWEEYTGAIYDKSYIAMINYIKEGTTKKTTFIVTNNEFSSVTRYDDQDYIQTSGTTSPFISKSHIYMRGYWGGAHRWDLTNLTKYSSTGTNYNYRNTQAVDDDNPDSIATSGWSSGIYYSTDNDATPVNVSASTVTKSGVSTDTVGYMYGNVAMNGIILSGKGTNSSGIDATRIFKSTDGGANFTESWTKQYYSFGGYLGAYPDYDGGKFLLWCLDTTSSNSGTNSLFSSSDGENWTDEGETSGSGPGSPSYRDWGTVSYNKHTSKFYRTTTSGYNVGSSTVYESSDGVTWSASNSTGLGFSLCNPCVMYNGDIIGMRIDGTDAKFYRYPRSGTSIDWSNPTLVLTQSIATTIASVDYGSGFYGPYRGGGNGG